MQALTSKTKRCEHKNWNGHARLENFVALENTRFINTRILRNRAVLRILFVPQEVGKSERWRML
jgi:hypothetical protein